MKSCLSIAIVSSLAAGCAIDADKGPEEDAPSVEGKDDSLRKPTDHGLIGFGQPQVASLTGSAGHHAWQFELSGAATVRAFTGADRDGELDTVLYLYRQRAAERGRFKVRGSCDGAGCAAPAGSCVFGSTYGELAEQPALEILGRNVLTAETEWLSELDRQRIVLAVQQSSHTDVTTAAEAFARVDGGEINAVYLHEPAARRAYVAYEYGAGDNSYGAIFARQDETIVASIHDGDLTGCETPAATCLLSESYSALMADPAFEVGATRRVLVPADVSGVQADQLVAAVKDVYSDVTTVAEALAGIDDDSVRWTEVTHRATGTRLVVVEFGAGDTSVGVVFFAGGTEHAGVISDGSIEQCAFLQ